MLMFPTKRVRQSLRTGLKYEHVYTEEEKAEFNRRVNNGENPSLVLSEIDKAITEDGWMMVTEE